MLFLLHHAYERAELNFLYHSWSCNYPYFLQMLETDLALLSENIHSIVSQGQSMAKAGHFDSDGILKSVDSFNKR